jgi:EmrB/QacA subfamily drug resistance transporter
VTHQARRDRLAANFWWIFAVIGFGSFLGPMSGSIVNVALPQIAASYGVDVQSIKWVVLSYLMVTTSLLPFTGKLGQKFGESRIYTAGFISYGIGSAACALAAHASVNVLVAARSLEAAGSALLFGVGSALVTRYVPPERRGLAFGLFGSIVGSALIAGPVIGGIIAGKYGWPWIFWVLVPVSVLGTIAALILLPEEPGSPTNMPALSSVLWIALVASATLLGEAFSKGLWIEYLPITLAAVVLSLVGLIFSEKRGQPLFDYDLFKIPVYSSGALANFLIFVVIYPLIIFLPFYLETYRALSPEHAGMFLAISPLFTILIGPGSGHLADRIGYRIPILGGLALNALGYCLMALGIYLNHLLLVGVSLGVMGIGGALFSGPMFAAMMGSVGPHQRALASSFGSLTRNMGFLAGTSLSAIAFGLLLWQRGGHALMLKARSEELANAVQLPDFQYAFGGVLIGCAVLTASALIIQRNFPNKPAHQ